MQIFHRRFNGPFNQSAILNDVGINPLLARENVVWEPQVLSGQHGEPAQRALNELLEPVRGNRAEIERVLYEWALVSAGRGL